MRGTSCKMSWTSLNDTCQRSVTDDTRQRSLCFVWIPVPYSTGFKNLEICLFLLSRNFTSDLFLSKGQIWYLVWLLKILSKKGVRDNALFLSVHELTNIDIQYKIRMAALCVQIQANVQVLTSERDKLSRMYEEVSKVKDTEASWVNHVVSTQCHWSWDIYWNSYNGLWFMTSSLLVTMPARELSFTAIYLKLQSKDLFEKHTMFGLLS